MTLKTEGSLLALAVSIACALAIVAVVLAVTGNLTSRASCADLKVKAELTTADGDAAVDEYVADLERRKHAWIVEQLIARSRAELTARLTAYMQRTGTVEGLVELAPLMVELAAQTGNDARLCPVTAAAESSGGRVCCGSHNPFGALGMSFASWEDAVRYYFRRISEFGFGGDVWHIAWYWYGGGESMGGKAETYADNVTGAVQSF